LVTNDHFIVLHEKEFACFNSDMHTISVTESL